MQETTFATGHGTDKMDTDLLLVQLAIIFLPGLIWARLDARWAQKIKPSDTEFVIRAFVFGVASYAFTFLIYLWRGWNFTVFKLSSAQPGDIITHDTTVEIAVAISVGLVLGLIWIYAANYSWLSRFLQWIKATKKYGDEDVWDFMFNSPRPEVTYVNLRDFEQKIVYAGWVDVFSETDKLRELVIRDARVFDFDGNLFFEVPRLYIARDPKCVHLEFPYKPQPNRG